MRNSNSNSLPQSNVHQGHPPKKREKKNRVLVIPKFLHKLSSTYFQRAVNESVISPKGSISNPPLPLTDTKIKDKPDPKKGFMAQLSGKMANHLRSVSLLDSHKMQNIHKIYDKNLVLINPSDILKTQENNLITLASVPEREQEKEEDFYKNPNLSPDFKLENLNIPETTFQNVISRNTKKHGRNYSVCGNLHKKQETFIMNNEKLQETEKYKNSPIIQDKLNTSGFGDKSTNSCLICFDKLPDSVFMDCGHGGVCYDCSLDLWKATGECYLCREEIVQVLQIDLNYKNKNYMKVISSTQMVDGENEEHSVQKH